MRWSDEESAAARRRRCVDDPDDRRRERIYPCRVGWLGWAVDRGPWLRGAITTAAALAPEVELAFDREGRAALAPRSCYAFSGRWRGPVAAARPRRFRLCPTGIYAGGRLYPLARGVWAWFRLNVD